MGFNRVGFCLGLLLSLGSASAAWAVEPLEDGVGVASSPESRSIVWSTVMADGAGPIVYDRHRIRPSLLTKVFLSAIGVFPSQDHSEILSSWSRSGIRVTRRSMVQVVDEVGDGRGPDRRRRGDSPGETLRPRPATFTYREEVRVTSPLSIEVLIKGRSLRYESGPVSAELAAALAQAPEGSLSMRLLWPDGSVTESKIGEGTVLGWRSVFR